MQDRKVKPLFNKGIDMKVDRKINSQSKPSLSSKN